MRRSSTSVDFGPADTLCRGATCISPSLMNLFVFVCECLLVMPSTKSTNYGSRYLAEGSSERDEIWQLDRGGLAVRHIPYQ